MKRITAALGLAMLFAAGSVAAQNCTIALDSNDRMQFDQKSVSVSSSCSSITVELTHSGSLPVAAGVAGAAGATCGFTGRGAALVAGFASWLWGVLCPVAAVGALAAAGAAALGILEAAGAAGLTTAAPAAALLALTALALAGGASAANAGAAFEGAAPSGLAAAVFSNVGAAVSAAKA